MKVQTVKVNPELAKQWLAKNNKNRTLYENHVRKLAGAMTRGEWVFNGESICFDQEYNLLDGQHRLSAVVKSGKTFDFVVVTGVEDDRAFQTYDTIQKTRSANQILRMMGGERNLTKLTSATRVVMFWERSNTMEEFANMIRFGFPKGKEVAPATIAEKAKETEEDFNYFWDFFGNKFRSQVKPKSYFYGLTMVLNNIDPVATHSFCEKIKGFSFESNNDPCLLLREKMIKGKVLTQRKTSSSEEDMVFAAIYIKAWNYHKLGKDAPFLRYSGKYNENFPRPIGSDKK